MKAVVWHDVGKISVDDVPAPAIREPADAIVRITTEAFPIGEAMNANLTVKLGNCNHRKYVPGLLSKIAAGQVDPTTVWTQQETIPTALQAYEAFDRREPGWTKVTLEVG